MALKSNKVLSALHRGRILKELKNIDWDILNYLIQMSIIILIAGKGVVVLSKETGFCMGCMYV